MSNQDGWAEALRIESVLGDFAPVWLAERIGYLSGLGDEAEARRFRDIADKLGLLRATAEVN